MSDERGVVASFLKKCNVYAEASIERKRERGELDDIPKWEAYIEFNQHALEEIANGTLDPVSYTHLTLPTIVCV